MAGCPLIGLFNWLGYQARWVLPIGLLAGVLLPWAAAPLATWIPLFILLLLCLSVLRLLLQRRTNLYAPSATDTRQRSMRILPRDGFLVLVAIGLSQLLLPLLIWLILDRLDVTLWIVLATTLVAAASPIAGSPNLVWLLKGDGALALSWLLLGTLVLPLSSLPILALLLPAHDAVALWRPAFALTLMIAVAVVLAFLIDRLPVWRQSVSAATVDGASSVVLALMVVGLMAALHTPDTTFHDVWQALLLAFVINGLLQCAGAFSASLCRLGRGRTITAGVACGNRNVSLFLAALPASVMEPILLFIACYQVPMYLTPLLGRFVYRRLSDPK